jgi:hypothetical protein
MVLWGPTKKIASDPSDSRIVALSRDESHMNFRFLPDFGHEVSARRRLGLGETVSSSSLALRCNHAQEGTRALVAGMIRDS